MTAPRRLGFTVALFLAAVFASLTLTRSWTAAQEELTEQVLWGIQWSVQPNQ